MSADCSQHISSEILGVLLDENGELIERLGGKCPGSHQDYLFWRCEKEEEGGAKAATARRVRKRVTSRETSMDLGS